MAMRKEVQKKLENTLDEVIHLMKIYNREVGGYTSDIVNKLKTINNLSSINVYSFNNIDENDSIKIKISKTLLAMGISTKLLAHQYIIELVSMGIEDINLIKPLNKVGYAKLSEKYGRSIVAIDKAIKKSIEDNMTYKSFDIWEEITGYTDDFPTVSQLITSLIEHFKYC